LKAKVFQFEIEPRSRFHPISRLRNYTFSPLTCFRDIFQSKFKKFFQCKRRTQLFLRIVYAFLEAFCSSHVLQMRHKIMINRQFNLLGICAFRMH